MDNKHIFEQITGLKPNKDILKILNNTPYKTWKWFLIMKNFLETWKFIKL